MKYLVVCICLIIGTSLSLNAYTANVQKIVSLKPNITDIVYVLGAGDKLVGVTKYCPIPEKKKRPTIVGDYTRPFTEKIIALGPDIILGSEENTSHRSVMMLSKLGLRVELLSFRNFENTLNSVKRIATLLGIPEKGKSVAKSMREKILQLSDNFGKGQKKRVLFVWGTRPFVVAGSGTYIDELMAPMGIVNAMKSKKTAYPRIGIEELIAIDPDVIVDLSIGHEANSTKRPWEGIDAVSAVKNGNVVSMDATELLAGPHLPDGLNKLAAMIHMK